MISKDIEAEIKRLYHAEHQSRHSIAKYFGIHQGTVNRVLGLKAKLIRAELIRSTLVDPFVPFVIETLTRHPRMRSTRLYLMLVDRGYKGSVQQLRRRVAHLRPQVQPRTHLPLSAFAGDEAQADWAHFGVIKVGKAERMLSCFVMVLSYSRYLFARFTFDQTLESFLRCHVLAFRHFGGAVRQVRYDNLKSAVIDRHGDAVRYNDALLELAGHYHFRPSACNPYSGNEKGRVERTIRFVRDSFATGRVYRDLADANSQLSEWVDKVANRRPWPDDRLQTVHDVWQDEQQRLLSLPANDLSSTLKRPTRSGKTPLVRFDRNDYSIPYQLVGKPLTLIANDDDVKIFEADSEIARHKRSYDQGQRIIDRSHFIGAYERRPGAETVTARAYLTALIPATNRLFELMVEHGVGLGAGVAKILSLITEYGEAVVGRAVGEAVTKEIARPAFVAQLCQRYALEKKATPTLPIDLPDRPGVRELTTKTHDPSNYDHLARNSDNKKPEEGDKHEP